MMVATAAAVEFKKEMMLQVSVCHIAVACHVHQKDSLQRMHMPGNRPSRCNDSKSSSLEVQELLLTPDSESGQNDLPGECNDILVSGCLCLCIGAGMST